MVPLAFTFWTGYKPGLFFLSKKYAYTLPPNRDELLSFIYLLLLSISNSCCANGKLWAQSLLPHLKGADPPFQPNFPSFLIQLYQYLTQPKFCEPLSDQLKQERQVKKGTERCISLLGVSQILREDLVLEVLTEKTILWSRIFHVWNSWTQTRGSHNRGFRYWHWRTSHYQSCFWYWKNTC